MALQLAQTHKGIVCNYHRISNVQVDRKAGMTSIVLGAYVNEQHRQTNPGDALGGKSFAFEGCDFTIVELYEKCKEPIIRVTAAGEEENVNPFVDAVDY